MLLLQASPPSSVETDDEVLISQVDDKGVFTMNRPKVLNALNISMIQRITAQLRVSFICSNTQITLVTVLLYMLHF